MTKNTIKGICAGMIATTIWGGFYPVSRLLFGYEGDSIEPLNFTFIRFMLASIFLSPILFQAGERERIREMLKSDWLGLGLLGIVGIVGEGLFVFWALKYTTGARASLMANTSPISTLIISWLAGREFLTGKKVLGMLIGFLGLVLVFLGEGNDRFAQEASTIVGDVMALFSGICWAIFTVYGDVYAKKYGGMLCCEMMFLVAGAFLLPIILVMNGGIILDLPWGAWLGALYLGLLSYGVGNTLWYVALRYLKPGQLGSFGYVSAMLSMSFSVLFVGEKITLSFFVAVVCVLGGVWLMLKQD